MQDAAPRLNTTNVVQLPARVRAHAQDVAPHVNPPKLSSSLPNTILSQLSSSPDPSQAQQQHIFFDGDGGGGLNGWVDTPQISRLHDRRR